MKDTFVKSPARKRRYLTHLQMNGILSSRQIPLPNKTRWSSWFRMIFYLKDHIQFWPGFYEAEYQLDSRNKTIATINSTLCSEQNYKIIVIFVHFICIYAIEFVQDLDFFQQQDKPLFPFVEGRLMQLTSFLESNRTA